MTAIPQIFDQILERTSGGKIKSGGRVPIEIVAVDATGAPRDPFEILQDIIKQTGGDKAKLGEFGFGGEGLQAVLGLAKQFEAAMFTTGGNIEQSRDIVANSLREAGGAVDAYGKILEKAADKSPADKIQEGLTRLQIAFTKPEVLGAFEQLASIMPRVVEALSSLMETVLDSPMASAGVLAGGVFAKGALGAIIQAAMAKGGADAGAAMGGAISKAGGSAAGAMGSAIGAAGAALVASLAVAAVGLAIDQGMKLKQELAEAEAHQEGITRDNIANANRAGVGASEGTPAFVFGGAEFGSTGGSDFVSLDESGLKNRRSAEFNMPGDTQAMSFIRQKLAEQGLGEFAGLGGKGGTMLGAQPANGDFVMTGLNPESFGPPIANNGRPIVNEEKIASGTGRAVAETLGQQELKVRIMNPEDIAGAGGGDTTSTKLRMPGWAKR